MKLDVTGMVLGLALEPLVRKTRRTGSLTRTPGSPATARSTSAEMSA